VFKAYFVLEFNENKIKKINKIKCFSDLPTLFFLPLKQETGLLFFLALHVDYDIEAIYV
jgi:hypothetical protein